jgi:hypothetical protein
VSVASEVRNSSIFIELPPGWLDYDVQPPVMSMFFSAEAMAFSTTNAAR